MLFLSCIFIVYVIIIKLHESSLSVCFEVVFSSTRCNVFLLTYIILYLSRFLSFNFVLFSKLRSAFQDV